MNLLKRIYVRSSGYSYTNLGRLFLRMFLGIMLIQFGVRRLINFSDVSPLFPSILGLPSETSLIVMICVELICSVFVMFGFLTRLMLIPPFIAMIIVDIYTYTGRIVEASVNMMTWQQHAYVPTMFLGIIFFLLLVGPGKISVDYFLSLHFIHSANKSEEEELEEV